MNPFKILEIDPTSNKMLIRRAYVKQTKQHHPDVGGDARHFNKIQTAYDDLINDRFKHETVTCDLHVPLKNMLEGCVATAVIGTRDDPSSIIEFVIPPFTYPGTKIEFFDKDSTSKKFCVTVLEETKKGYTRLDSNIVIKRQINKTEAKEGITLDVVNYDDNIYSITVSPETAADRLIFYVEGAGFYERNSCVRDKLTIIVEID